MLPAPDKAAGFFVSALSAPAGEVLPMLALKLGIGVCHGGRKPLLPPATISTSGTASVAENSVLAVSLQANQSVTWSIAGGADAARFEVSGSTLRWLSNGTKDYEVPNDADTNNTYVVTVRATNVDAVTADKAITVTVTDVDDTAPTITSSASPSVAENATLAHALTANETVTWALNGGVDAAKFEISGSTLRWLSNGTKDYEAPDDTGTNNVYNVTVRATDTANNTADQNIAVTVTDVVEVPPPARVSETAYNNDTGAITSAVNIFTAINLSNCQMAVVVVSVQDSFGAGDLSTSSTGWLKAAEHSNGTLNGTAAVFYKVNPTSNETLTVSSTSNQYWKYHSLIRVSNANSIAVAVGVQNSGAANTPSLDAGASRPHLWVSAGLHFGSVPTAAPAGYSNLLAHGPDWGAFLASKASVGQVEDPGAFTGGGGYTVNFTIALWQA